MSVTIREVALRAGVSTATVSRVFNNAEPVDERTRERVRMAAKELNYVPNALGRSLSLRKTDAIGLLLPDLFGEFFSEVIRGCDQTAQQNHFHLIVSSSHSNRQEIETALRVMRGRVDGLVIMSPHIDSRALNENLPRTLPVVLLNCHVESDGFDSLTIDNFGGAHEMTRHLLSHGHRRVAIIAGTEGNYDAAERLRGFRAAMSESGAEMNQDLVAQASFSEASGYDAVNRLLALSNPPSGIFASNDAMAIGALSALRDAGIQIPEQVALAGFDDIPVCKYLTPTLTSVTVNIEGLGARAMETVLHAVRNKNAHRKQEILLPVTLNLRESCGCTLPHQTTE
ncbi:MAG TPA: LacI family DNA-binding transcriptional regulator [Bacteroidota bacterium]|nr:LacI family DNA-binding transcriptional regulator [Bacteroidota bacterium]